MYRFILSLTLGIYVLLLPPFLKSGTPSGHDVGIHLVYLRLFTDALVQDQFPVRWTEWFTPGLSHPLFFFYQPLFYYLAQIPHFLGASLLDSAKITILSMWLLSGFLLYRFVKNITKNTLAGIIAAAIFVFSPYHILDVFVRAAYPETTALGFIPGIFWASERLITTTKKNYLAYTSLFFAAALISHPPTLIIFAIPYACYGGFLLCTTSKTKEQFLKKFLLISAGWLGGLSISCFFWLPAFVEQTLVHYAILDAGYYNFKTHFVCLPQLFQIRWGFGYSVSGCYDAMSFQVGLVNWLVLCAAITLVIRKARRFRLYDFHLLLWIVFAFFGLYMTVSSSLPVWLHIPYLSFIQYPWRFLSVVIFSIAVIAGLLFSYLKKRNFTLILYYLFLLILVGSVYPYLHPRTYFPKNYLEQDANTFYLTEDKKKPINIPEEFGYFPKWTKKLPQTNTIPVSEIISRPQNMQIFVLKKSFIRLSFLLATKEESEITIFIHYFPGWKFFIDKKEVRSKYLDNYGFPHFVVGKGLYIIDAFYTDTPLVLVGNIISLFFLVSALIIIAVSSFEKKSRDKNKKCQKHNRSACGDIQIERSKNSENN